MATLAELQQKALAEGKPLTLQDIISGGALAKDTTNPSIRNPVTGGLEDNPFYVRAPQTTMTPTRDPRSTSGVLDTLQAQIEAQQAGLGTSAQNNRQAIADELEANLSYIDEQTAKQVREINQQETDIRGQARGINARAGLVGTQFANQRQQRIKDVASQQRGTAEAIGANKKAMLQAESTRALMAVEDAYNAQIQSLRQEQLGIISAGIQITETEKKVAAERLATIAKAGTMDFETFQMAQFDDESGAKLRDVMASQLSGKNLDEINDADRLYADSLFQNNLPKELQTEFTEKLLPNEDGTTTLYRYRVGSDGNVEEQAFNLQLPFSAVGGTGGKWTTFADASGQVYMRPESIDPTRSLDEQLIRVGGPKPVEPLGGGGAVTGNVARDAESIMSGELNLSDVSTAKNYRSLVAAELKVRSDEAKEKGDVYGLMRSSAAYDKEVSDTFLQSMEKTISVLDQMGVLQENIAGLKTGPIVGTLRSKNPWDTQAQTIKAQLNAIVPNLARGVYGEVGVLTDNDIKTYSKTIPNLSATEDVRNAILYITVDMIRRNIETKIKNQAAGQRDMSGYADIYKQVVDTSRQILSTLPGASASGGESGVLTSPDGTQQVDTSELTEEQIQEAKNAGWQ